MNFKLLRFSLASLGLLSVCFAAEIITGEVVEDLFFFDSVEIAGVIYPTDLEATIGTSTVSVEGTGSVTVGDRNDGGTLRLIVWGGTEISSERHWGESDTKDWWEGELNSPVRGRVTPADEIEFEVIRNHEGSQIATLGTYGLGLDNETFGFAPAATLVLPVTVPDLTKVWFAIKKGETLDKIGEEDFCVIQNQLCVVDIDSVNEITLVREKFDDCLDVEIENGSVGSPPYCQVECNRGFVFNANLTGCVPDDDDSAIEIFETDGVETEGATVKRTGETGLLSGPARQGYIRYTGSNVQRVKTNVEGLSGVELQEALKMNASIGARNTKGVKKESGISIASLKEQLNDVRGKIWTWENSISPEVVIAQEDLVDEGAIVVATEQGEESHASAPLLPSTGPAGVFVGIATLGFGLMAFSRRKRQ